jgi:hypothetical protein
MGTASSFVLLLASPGGAAALAGGAAAVAAHKRKAQADALPEGQEQAALTEGRREALPDLEALRKKLETE